MTNLVIPNTFATATDTIQLSKLDDNFTYLANAVDSQATATANDISDLNNTINSVVTAAGFSTSVYTATIYLQSGTAPLSPSGGTYNFQTNTLVPPTGWYITRPPSSTTPTYAVEYTFTTIDVTLTITATSWGSPTIIAQNGIGGANGVSIITMEIYSVNLSATPTGGSYLFASDYFNETGLTTGWHREMPTTSITPTYRSAYTFITSSPGTPVNAGVWSTPILVAVNGTDGIDAMSVVLSNSAHTIPTDSAGGNGIYLGSGTEIHVYEGNSELIYNGVGNSSGTWKVLPNGTDITVGSLINTNPHLVVGNHSGITSDTASVLYTITGQRADGTAFTINSTQTFSRVKTGFDAISYKLITSSSVLRKSATGTFTPSTISVSALRQSNQTPVSYSGRFKIYENGSGTASYSSSGDEASKTYTPSSSSVTSITIELYEAGGTSNLLDTETIPVVSDGADGANGSTGLDGLGVILSNESHTIPTDSSGANGIYTGSGTQIRLYEGGSELVYDGTGTTNGTWKVVVSANSITAGSLTDSGSYVTVGDHSSMTADTAVVTFTITGKRLGGGSISLVKTQTLSKSKTGLAGVDSISYWLICPAAALQKSVAGVFTPPSMSFSAISQTGSGTPGAYSGRFKIYENGTAVYTSSANESFKIYTPSSSSVTSVKVELYQAGGTIVKIDEQTIPVVNDGPTGAAGANGITPVISNANHSIPTDYQGGSGNYTGSGTTIKLFEGSTELTYDGLGLLNGTWKVTAVATGITAGSATDSGTFVTIGDSSNMTADTATIVYTITGKRSNGSDITGVTLTQSIAKVKSGSPGLNSTSYRLVSTANVLQKSIAGIFNPTTVTFAIISQSGSSVPAGYSGRFKIYENGSATAAYTSSINELQKDYTPSSSSVTSIKVEAYLAGGTTTQIDTTTIPVVTDGNTGFGAITSVLSNVAHTVPTDYAGGNGTYTGSGTTLRVYEGIDVLNYDGVGTSNGTWTFTTTASNITRGSITDSGAYATIGDASTMTADTASITYNISGKRGTGQSFTSSIIQTFSKSKSGGNGADSTAYWSVVSAAAIQKSATAVYTPTTITISLYSASGSGSPGLYSGRFIIATSTDGSTYTDTYTSSANESSKTYTIPTSIKTIRLRSYLAGGTTTLVDEQIIPIVADGTPGVNGATGAVGVSGASGVNGVSGASGVNGSSGDSIRIAYSKTTLSSLASTPTTITTAGSTSYPANDSWGTGTVWTSVASPISSGESLYQTNGVYSPSTGNTVWGLPYLSNLKVGTLSAITANMGSITGGSISLGSGNFQVDNTGAVQIQNASSGARMVIKNNVIKVYDASGFLRVQLGDLSA